MTNIVQELSDRDWLLIRPQNIIGSMQPIEQSSFLFDTKDKKFKWSTYKYIPGLIKIINEIIDNSVDVAIKSNFKFANEISIDVNHNKITVHDNGYGIPVSKTPDGIWSPVIAWGRARAGSNFEDDESRVSAGMNGIGSFATTVFSKKFVGVTDDGKKRLKVTFKNNCESNEVEELTSVEHGTTVSFFPDLEKFKVKEISELHQSLIFQRILNLSMMYPEIRFKFNKRLVKADAKKFLGLFADSYEYIEEDNYIIAVLPNEEADFRFHSYVNSLWLERGGTHVQFLSSKISGAIRDKLIRKYKSIKPGDIKNKLTMIAFFKRFPNSKYDSQTKEFLTNTQGEVTAFLDMNSADNKKDWERFYQKIYKNKAIMEPITDLYNARLLIEERKKLKKVIKKTDLPTKFWPATKVPKRLFLAEGDSAIGAVSAEVGREENGFFPLKGVPLNVVKDRSKLATNPEIQQLASILGMDLTNKDNRDLTYEQIVIAADMDVDGAHIAGILLGLFMEYAPWYLKNGRIFMFMTPLVTIAKKSGVLVQSLFTMPEYHKFREDKDPIGNKFIYDYKKGLGSMEEKDWEFLFKKFSLVDLMKPLHIQNSSEPEAELLELRNWLSDDSDFRKKRILTKIATFDINSA